MFTLAQLNLILEALDTAAAEADTQRKYKQYNALWFLVEKQRDELEAKLAYEGEG